MLISILILTFAIFHDVLAVEKEMTVNIEPGKEDCFYQEVKQGETIDFEYQVIDGGHGDLDITFRIADPTGRILVADFKKPENTHTLDASMSGDYKFCFDNSYSSYNTKTVFFGLLLDEDDESDEVKDMKVSDTDKEEQLDLAMEDLQGALNTVKTNLAKARHLQELIMSFESRDRNIAEKNYSKVNLFSFVQVCLMITVGLVQVLMVKSLFDVDSKVQKFLKKIDRKS